jgi:two-component system response regulator CpxR
MEPTAVKSRILIIDDETSTLQMLQDFLRDEYDVTVADDLLAGTRDLLNQTYDLLILDVRLPGMGAYDYLQTLISGHHFADLPVLMVSADREAPERFVSGPKRAYLRKPLRPAALMGTLHQLLNTQTTQP